MGRPLQGWLHRGAVWAAFALLYALRGATGAITGASVSPTSLSAGVRCTASVALTSSAEIPVGGSIVVIFPAGFYVTTTTITAIASGLHASSTVASTPATSLVTVTVGTSALPPGNIAFTIDGVTNPGTQLRGVVSAFAAPLSLTLLCLSLSVLRAVQAKAPPAHTRSAQ
ncbi:hypothetical protein PybrP1_010157 [[Pythium] brassicae (nom. inval.)]|nr:hypothetical protein PybrP1_010157 [[Pythium] brassicae (nom. inval.)]